MGLQPALQAFRVPSQKQPDQHFRAGEKIRVNLYHGKIEDAVVHAAIEHKTASSCKSTLETTKPL